MASIFKPPPTPTPDPRFFVPHNRDKVQTREVNNLKSLADVVVKYRMNASVLIEAKPALAASNLILKIQIDDPRYYQRYTLTRQGVDLFANHYKIKYGLPITRLDLSELKEWSKDWNDQREAGSTDPFALIVILDCMDHVTPVYGHYSQEDSKWYVMVLDSFDPFGYPVELLRKLVLLDLKDVVFITTDDGRQLSDVGCRVDALTTLKTIHFALKKFKVTHLPTFLDPLTYRNLFDTECKEIFSFANGLPSCFSPAAENLVALDCSYDQYPINSKDVSAVKHRENNSRTITQTIQLCTTDGLTLFSETLREKTYLFYLANKEQKMIRKCSEIYARAYHAKLSLKSSDIFYKFQLTFCNSWVVLKDKSPTQVIDSTCIPKLFKPKIKELCLTSNLAITTESDDSRLTNRCELRDEGLKLFTDYYYQKHGLFITVLNAPQAIKLIERELYSSATRSFAIIVPDEEYLEHTSLYCHYSDIDSKLYILIMNPRNQFHETHDICQRLLDLNNKKIVPLFSTPRERGIDLQVYNLEALTTLKIVHLALKKLAVRHLPSILGKLTESVIVESDIEFREAQLVSSFELPPEFYSSTYDLTRVNQTISVKPLPGWDNSDIFKAGGPQTYSLYLQNEGRRLQKLFAQMQREAGLKKGPDLSTSASAGAAVTASLTT